MPTVVESPLSPRVTINCPESAPRGILAVMLRPSAAHAVMVKGTPLTVTREPARPSPKP
jgi:hypothetical protein